MSVVPINYTCSSHTIHKDGVIQDAIMIVNIEHVQILQCSPYTEGSLVRLSQEKLTKPTKNRASGNPTNIFRMLEARSCVVA
jgi:hypothetical protein